MPVVMESCLFNKMFLCLLIVSSCCFHLSLQQFEFNEYDDDAPGPGPGGWPNAPGPGPGPGGWPNAPGPGPGPGQFSNFRGGPSQSNLRVGNWIPAGQELVFSRNGNNVGGGGAGGSGGNNPTPPARNPTPPTMGPFTAAVQPPSPQFFQCLQGCPTTSEYNPVCASNRQQYGNEQKFNCARRCGLDIQIVRRTSCEGLVQMQRG